MSLSKLLGTVKKLIISIINMIQYIIYLYINLKKYWYILFLLIILGIIWVSHLRIIIVLAEFLVLFDWQMTAVKYRNSTSTSTGRATFCENIRPSLKFLLNASKYLIYLSYNFNIYFLFPNYKNKIDCFLNHWYYIQYKQRLAKILLIKKKE